jgi:two-component system NtrC family sensor kinase
MKANTPLSAAPNPTEVKLTPIVIPSAALGRIHKAPPPTGEETPRLLVVDDEPEIAESLADFLIRKEGYHIDIVSNGQEAMRFLEASLLDPAEAVDLMLLDVRMPVMSGLDVLAWLRQHPQLKYTRVIVLTAASGSQEKVEALSAGADDYITKPYYPHELLARVQTMLRARQLEKQLQRQSRQLAALNRVTHEVTATLDTRQVLAAAAEGAETVLGVAAAAVLMHDSEHKLLRCRVLQSSNPDLTPRSWPPVPIGQGLLGTLLVQRAGLYLNDPAGDPRFRPELDTPPDLPIHSLAATPLIMRGRAVGVLAAYNKKNGDFTDVDADLLASLATSISRAIENAWLFQRIQLRQQELLESHNTLHAVIDGILDPIYTINGDWQVVAANQSKADSMSSTPAALVGQTCYQVFFGRNLPCEHCQAALTLARQQPHRWTVRWPGADHLPEEWEVSAYPLPGTKAGSARAVIVWQDRTEERRLENSLAQAGKLAAIGQLAAGVAHEINNPLAVINANAQLLKMVIPPEEENYEPIDLIARAGDRAAKVVRGLLDFARQAQYEFEPAAVNDSILQALDLVSYQLSSANIQVVQNLAADLPDVEASWEHLKSVWLNLYINARDALLEISSERLLEISTSLNPAGSHIQVMIRDNGPGMTAAELGHIFEPFYTTKAPGKGTGLGLATSHRILEQHGGDVEVVSQPGIGTTFVVRLPVNRP